MATEITPVKVRVICDACGSGCVVERKIIVSRIVGEEGARRCTKSSSVSYCGKCGDAVLDAMRDAHCKQRRTGDE